MIFKNIFLFLFLAYPTFYGISFIANNYGHFFEVIYFSILSIIILPDLVTTKSFYKIKNTSFYIILVLLTWLISFNNFNNIRPYFALIIFYIFSIYFLSKNFYSKQTLKILNLYIMLFIILSFIMLLFPSSYIDAGLRFKSFNLSPTHFSVYTLIIIIFTQISTLRQRYKYLIYFISIAFIIYSGTKLSIVALILIYLIYKFKKIILKHRLLFAFLIFLIFAFAYPLYEFLNNYLNISSLRYKDGMDMSLYWRLEMQQILMQEIKNSSILQLIFGHGNETSRFLILQNFGIDVQSHNDFLRIFCDFGLLGFVSFIALIISLASKNLYSLMFSIVYFSAFYHNMLYSSYLLSCLLCLASFNLNVVKNTFIN